MAIGGVIRAFIIIADSRKSSFDRLFDDPEDALENFVFVAFWPFFYNVLHSGVYGQADKQSGAGICNPYLRAGKSVFIKWHRGG